MNPQTAPTRSLIRIRGSATLQDAAQLMCDMSMGALGVDDANHEFVGLVTERDVLWAVARGMNPLETRVAEIVNDFPIVVVGPVSIETAAERMTAGHVRHLVVRDEGGLRVVSMRDLLHHYVLASNSSASPHVVSAPDMSRMFGASALDDSTWGSHHAKGRIGTEA